MSDQYVGILTHRQSFDLLKLLHPAVPVAVIASMSLRCGAGQTDDVSERRRNKVFWKSTAQTSWAGRFTGSRRLSAERSPC